MQDHVVAAAPTPDGLVIELRPDRERVVVAVGGELDLATVGDVEQAVGDLYRRGFSSVALDLRSLAFIDSSGLWMLVRLDELAAARGCTFAIIDGDGPARRLLELTRLDRRFAHAAA